MAEFKNSDAGDEVLPEGQQGRRRRQKKLLPTPLLRLIVALVAIIVVIVVIVVAVTTTRGGGDAADYQKYMASVSTIVKQSDAIGADLTELLSTPADTNRKEIQTQLDGFVSKSIALENQAKELAAPKALIEQNIQQFFVLVMTFRREGLESLEPSLMNALEVEDTEVAAEQISQALHYLTNSDFLYATVFVKGATDVVKERSIDGVTVPSSKFLDDPDLASKAAAQEIISQLKSTGSLQAVHGVSVAKVVAQPDEQQIKNGQTYNLTASDELAFSVTVENQGNMAEKDIPVVITLGTDSGDPQKITVTIPEIKGGEDTTVEVTGIDPTDYGEQATLTVEVGPVAGEKVTTNNSLEATVIFKL